MDQKFKDEWLKNLNSGKYKRKRYGLSDGDKELCVMAVAHETAVEMHILPDCDMTERDLLTDEELKAIGMSQEAQFYLSTMNDTYVATGKEKFPIRLINAVKALPVYQEREKVPLLTHKKD